MPKRSIEVVTSDQLHGPFAKPSAFRPCGGADRAAAWRGVVASLDAFLGRLTLAGLGSLLFRVLGV
jgi:hypothetical protein